MSGQKNEQYQAAIKQLGWKELRELWEKILAGDTPDWPAGKAFEYLVIRMFELDDFKVKYPYSVSLPYQGTDMEQIDGVLYYQSLGILVESKDWSAEKDGKREKKRVNIEPIAKLRNQLSRRPFLTLGCVFSAGGFTEPVTTLMSYLGNETILLWEGEEVEFCLDRKKVRTFFQSKLENRIEFGISDFNITTLDF